MLASLAIAVAAVTAASVLAVWYPTGAGPVPPRSVGTSRAPGLVASPSATLPASATAAGGVSVFTIAGTVVDELGGRAVRGYAFVVRSERDHSDLITDYHIVVADYLNGIRAVELQRGSQTYTAQIIAVNPDPHVALLRIRAQLPTLPIAPDPPSVGATVAIDYGQTTATRAAVVPSLGLGGHQHMSFSVEVANTRAGAPVVDSRGQVVGITEPTSQFGTQAAGLGFALRIRAACKAVAAC